MNPDDARSLLAAYLEARHLLYLSSCGCEIPIRLRPRLGADAYEPDIEGPDLQYLKSFQSCLVIDAYLPGAKAFLFLPLELAEEKDLPLQETIQSLIDAQLDSLISTYHRCRDP